MLREGICFYKALTVARKYLWLRWPTATHGENTAPASATLAQVLQYLAEPPYAPTAAQLAAAPAAALDVLGLLSQQPGAVSYTHLGYARISYAYSVDHLQTAMKRIREFLKEHGWIQK